MGHQCHTPKVRRGRAGQLQKGQKAWTETWQTLKRPAAPPDGTGVPITSQTAHRRRGGSSSPPPRPPTRPIARPCPSRPTENSLALSSANPPSRARNAPLNYTSTVFALDSCHPVIYPYEYTGFNCALIFPICHSSVRICNSSTLGHFVYSLTKTS